MTNQSIKNALAIVSLALCVFTAALWVRSGVLNHGRGPESGYGFSDYVEWTTKGGDRWHVRANPDRITIFKFGAGDTHVPWWLVLGVTALLPLDRVVHICRQRGRRRLGQCGVCGYDLRGAVDGRCSECGTAIGTA